MFSWFKRKKFSLSDWNFSDLSEFDRIENPDSIQYVNKDLSRIVYFSQLVTSEGEIFPADFVNSKPAILAKADGWELKGFRKQGTKILICVISISAEEEIVWAETFFRSIVPA